MTMLTEAEYPTVFAAIDRLSHAVDYRLAICEEAMDELKQARRAWEESVDELQAYIKELRKPSPLFDDPPLVGRLEVMNTEPLAIAASPPFIPSPKARKPRKTAKKGA